MNKPSFPSVEGLTRRLFSVADVERMTEAGLLAEDERVELIFGELIAMAAKGSRHEAIKLELNLLWGEVRPKQSNFIPATTNRLSPNTFIEPDFIVFPRSVPIRDIDGANVQLAVEVADSSLVYDLGLKAKLYAHFGIRELWVIDAVSRVIHRFQEPAADGYRSMTLHNAATLIVPAFAPPEFALRLADLDTDADGYGDDAIELDR